MFDRAIRSLRTNCGLGSQVPNRAPETASSFSIPLFCRPIVEANAAPLIATAAYTVRSRRMRGGEATCSGWVLNQPSSGPPT